MTDEMVSGKAKQCKSISWSPSASECLVKFLAEQATNGSKPEKGFKSTTYSAAARHVNEKLQTNYTEINVQNHLRTIRRNWKIIQKLKLMSGNSYDHNTNMIVMDEDKHPKEEKFVNKPIKHYKEMERICGNELATGESHKDFSTPVSAPWVMTSDPSSPIIHPIKEDVDGEDVQTVTPPSVTPIPHDGGSRKRKSIEEDCLGQYFAEMKEVLQDLNTTRTLIILAKEIKAAMEIISSKYTPLTLCLAQNYLIKNEGDGACFISYSTSEKICWMNDFLIRQCSGMDGTSGRVGMNDIGGTSGRVGMNDIGGTSGMDGTSGGGGGDIGGFDTVDTCATSDMSGIGGEAFF